ncbi:MAG TPA: MarR family transcriptional regulator [Mycobacteriales bacterium]|nr:MarR family transcriptional regulator [Mycobacteriales bacterium]
MIKEPAGPEQAAPSIDAREVWAVMCELVLDNVRRREVSETLGMSFSRVRAIRRIARRPMSMGELARSLEMDPPNVTTMVDELEELGLAKRRPHPTDRRAKLVEATRKGTDIARRADEILSTPPQAMNTLDPADLEQLRRILRPIAAQRGS